MTVEPSFRVVTSPARRRTPSCWDRCDSSIPTRGWSSPTLSSRSLRTSSARTRAGWARALNRSALISLSGRCRSWAGSFTSLSAYLMYLSDDEVDRRTRSGRDPAAQRDAAVRADPDRGPRAAPALRTRHRTRDHPASDGRVVSVRVARDLAGVDWLALTSDLVADNFDNGRIPAALHRSFAQS